jgi:hypothetical protein
VSRSPVSVAPQGISGLGQSGNAVALSRRTAPPNHRLLIYMAFGVIDLDQRATEGADKAHSAHWFRDISITIYECQYDQLSACIQIIVDASRHA